MFQAIFQNFEFEHLKLINMRSLVVFLLTLLITSHTWGQQKREFRAAWIATVGNIDWPSKQGLSAQQQQQEFINHLNYLKSAGFNAVIVQVRPAADVFYESQLEPWSRYLSGKQGQPPFPKYDPLDFMIEETHKRNMEFHAWFNPFRALVSNSFNPNPESHPTKKHPDWIIPYDGKSYFDPGNAQARQHIIKVIMEAVNNYDLDAVHIDDYFYPYPVAGKTFNDETSYKLTNSGMSKADWRRSNVNTFIWQLNNDIKNKKPWVKFGVSPFGVWRNINKDPRGSYTNGATACYDDLYSDVLHWIDKRWVDYVAPQLYWEHGHRIAPYDVLLPWWKKNTENTQYFVGLGVYRMVDAKPGSKYFGTQEILKQIEEGRKVKANGFIMYSMKSFSKISNALYDSLKYEYFADIAFPPAHKIANYLPPTAPNGSIQTNSQGILLKWNNTPQEKGIPGKIKYAIYRFKANEQIDINKSRNLIALTSSKQFLDKEGNANYKYVITSIDRAWNESEPSNIIQL